MNLFDRPKIRQTLTWVAVLGFFSSSSLIFSGLEGSLFYWGSLLSVITTLCAIVGLWIMYERENKRTNGVIPLLPGSYGKPLQKVAIGSVYVGGSLLALYGMVHIFLNIESSQAYIWFGISGIGMGLALLGIMFEWAFPKINSSKEE